MTTLHDETEAEEIENPDVFNELETVLNTIAAEGNEAVKVKIYRLRAGKRAWLFDALPSDMDDLLPTLRDHHDGGQFEAFVYRGNKIATRKTFDVEPPKKAPVLNVPQTSSEMTLVLEGMKGISEGLNTLGQMLVQMQSPQNAAPPKSPQEQMTEMLTLMATMKEVMGTGNQPAPQSDMTTFLKGVEFAKEIAGETLGEKSDPTPGQVLMTLADKLAPTISELVKQNGNKSQIKTPVNLTSEQRRILAMRKAAAEKAATNQQPQQTQQTTQEPKKPMNMMKIAMKPQLEKILAYANQGMTPQQMAPEVLDAVPDNFYNAFGDFIFSEDCIEQMIDIVPAIKEKSDWFIDLRANIMMLMDGGSELDLVDDFDTDIMNDLTEDPEAAILDETETEPLEGEILPNEQNNGTTDADTQRGSGDTRNT